jgi:hypothetical protein
MKQKVASKMLHLFGEVFGHKRIISRNCVEMDMVPAIFISEEL